MPILTDGSWHPGNGWCAQVLTKAGKKPYWKAITTACKWYNREDALDELLDYMGHTMGPVKNGHAFDKKVRLVGIDGEVDIQEVFTTAWGLVQESYEL